MIEVNFDKMQILVDFDNAQELLNEYGGSEYKKTVVRHNIKYMLKFANLIREKDHFCII